MYHQTFVFGDTPYIAVISISMVDAFERSRGKSHDGAFRLSVESCRWALAKDLSIPGE